ncbi:DUF2155 domain-containing protein [Roseovarius aestuariivivens]|uniref:DUF2155 domain-containing protein n=1 Tax=Roseovarius aestuariivivens TaxID=1888910 RepID=UPI001081DBC5|nr:DUF2155 domain-containing protein [Roseovarius aestuariivivens]
MMWRAAAVMGLACFAFPLGAQEQAEIGTGAVLRWLDRTAGETGDVEVSNASAVAIGKLRVELGECRYPAGNPSGDAFAFLTVHPEEGARPIYSGWMIASSPALNPLEHPRYDIWVLRCTTG